MTIAHIKMMFKNTVLFLFALSFNYIEAQITLTTNVGDDLIDSGMVSCDDYDENWSKIFELSDFGITTDQQFIVESGQVAFSHSFGGARVGMAIFSIDDNFPNSYAMPINGGGYQLLPEISGAPQIIDINFSTPIVIPAGVKKILVKIVKYDETYNPNSSEVTIAGTKFDTGSSWYTGCRKYYDYTATENLETPVPNANFFINITGKTYSASNYGAKTTLTHNFCDDLSRTMHHSCSSSFTYFGRDFYLADYGISENEAFVINSGEVGISYSSWGATVKFNIYEIDDNFPDSFSEANLIGSSQEYQFPYMSDLIRILKVDFDTPVIIPASVKRVLVEVKKGVTGNSSALAHIAGTAQDDGAPSWYRGCVAGPNYVNTDGINQVYGYPGKDYNLYINVKGLTKHTTNNFEMNITNICSEFLKEFSVEKKSEVASIVWDFNDPASGADNTSTDLSPYHDFSSDGTYTITAIVTANNGNVETLTETIDVKEPPKAYGINNLETCEDDFGTGISSSFDTSNLLTQVLGGQTNKVVTFIDGSGNEYNQLPNPFTNTLRDRETIIIQVSRNEEKCCYSEISFDLIVNQLPDISTVSDVYECDTNNDGFTTFNLTQIKSDLLVNSTSVEFYFENGQQLADTQLNVVVNMVKDQETITAKVFNSSTNCNNTTTFKIIVARQPIANTLAAITGCDDNNDGISEYFDTSNIETLVLGNQTGMEVSYYSSNGDQLTSPLPNPHTNAVANIEIITVRVTNPQTSCYAETFLELTTSTQPQINQPQPLYACDTGNGIAYFDTATIQNEIIGNQTGLLVFYADENGNQLPSPLPINYQNSKAWSQTINVSVENELNSLCYSETSFDMIVNQLPQINLEVDYFLCDLEPFLHLTTDATFHSWEWSFEDGSVISNTFEANLIEAGIYTLWVSKINNGISCENSFSFKLIRSILPKIDEVKIQDISDNNYIEISTSGDGDFEYTIDGLNFQDSNTFYNLLGGVYNVQVRDKKGCGLDAQEVVLVDYPIFFTPNNDGFNDYWHIRGIEKFPNAVIYIFDRFGKLLKKLESNDLGWDGTFNGASLFAADYWFTADLGNGRNFKGHFSLIR